MASESMSPNDGLALAVVVLAAGQGRRLGPAAASLPKWLTRVGDHRIADYQLDALERCLVPAHDRVVVVAGHSADALHEWLVRRASKVHREVVWNPCYAERNNWYSLLVAFRHLQQAGWAGRVAILNSDLCAGTDWYADFLLGIRTVPDIGLCLMIDFDRPLVAEAMKVATRLSGGKRLCTAIGKVGVDSPDGEYVGLAAADVRHWRRLMVALEEFERDERRFDEWYEAAFRVLIENDAAVLAWATPSSHWVEVDDENDLRAATRLMTPA